MKAVSAVQVDVIAKTSGAHLGHLFDDGFDVTRKKAIPNSMRCCINSAALKFVPMSKFKEEGLEKYMHLFGPVPDKK